MYVFSVHASHAHLNDLWTNTCGIVSRRGMCFWDLAWPFLKYVHMLNLFKAIFSLSLNGPAYHIYLLVWYSKGEGEGLSLILNWLVLLYLLQFASVQSTGLVHREYFLWCNLTNTVLASTWIEDDCCCSWTLGTGWTSVSILVRLKNVHHDTE